MRFHFLMLMAVMVFARGAMAISIDSVSIEEPQSGQAVPQYGKLELLVSLSGVAATHFYEPLPANGGLNLTATFTAPGGAQTTVPGYYDGASWRVRFSPKLVGSYSFTVSATDASGSAATTAAAFDVVASSWPGFAAVNGHYLQYSNGTVCFAVGHNNGWQYDVEQPSFADMAAMKENVLSFWMASPWIIPSDNIPRAPIENAVDGVGNYNQASCAYLDGVVSRAETAGVCLLPSLWAHDQLCDGIPSGWPSSWQNNGYKALCSATDFYKTVVSGVDTAQWRYQKNYYRYVLARWGYSRAIIGWVAVVEIDGTTGYVQNSAQCSTWSSALRTYFSTNDPYRVSAAGKYPMAISRVDQAGFDIGQDMRATDSYTSQTDKVGVANTIASQITTMWSSGKPAFHAEFGASQAALQPTHLHNGVWAGSSAGACMTPLLWCDGGSFPMMTDPTVGSAMRTQLQNLADFMGGVSFLGSAATTAASPSFNSTALRGWGLKNASSNATVCVAWIQNKNSGTFNSTQNVSIANVVKNSSYKIEWFNTWSSGATPFQTTNVSTSKQSTTLTVSFPTLAQSDIAVRITKQ